MPRPIHFEIPAEDPARAITFYETVFGWKFQKWEGGAAPYWLISTGEGPGIDGAIGFMPVAEDYNYDVSDRGAAGGYDLIGVAIHEITHAMGRLAGDSAFQMVDYFSPGVMNTLLSGIGGYFSVDGGKTGLASFALSDLADWSNQAGDEANAIAFPGLVNSISDIDKLMNVVTQLTQLARQHEERITRVEGQI